METTLSIPRELQVTRSTLENGLKVLIREIPNAPVAGCWTIYRVGSRNENDPEFQATEELFLTAFRYHPYRWSEGGTKPDLQRITRDDLFEHYRRYYAPGNAMLVVAGPFSPKKILPKIEESFAPLSKTDNPPEPNIIDPSVFALDLTVWDGVNIDKAEKLLFEEIEKVKISPPSRHELDRSLAQIRSQYSYTFDGVARQGFVIGIFEQVISFETVTKLVDKLSKVTADKISEIARKYLTVENRTVCRTVGTRNSHGH